MTVLFILVPLALIVSAFAVAAFIWAARAGQLDDLETPAHRILFDDDDAPEPPTGRDETPKRV